MSYRSKVCWSARSSGGFFLRSPCARSAIRSGYASSLSSGYRRLRQYRRRPKLRRSPPVCQLNKPTQCEVHLAPREASPGQLAAWAWLWTRLLGQGSRVPDTRQPQDPVEPGAATVATVGSGHTLLSEHTRVHHDLGYTVSSMKGGTDYVTVSRYPHSYHRRVRFDKLDRGRVYGTGALL